MHVGWLHVVWLHVDSVHGGLLELVHIREPGKHVYIVPFTPPSSVPVSPPSGHPLGGSRLKKLLLEKTPPSGVLVVWGGCRPNMTGYAMPGHAMPGHAMPPHGAMMWGVLRVLIPVG